MAPLQSFFSKHNDDQDRIELLPIHNVSSSSNHHLPANNTVLLSRSPSRNDPHLQQDSLSNNDLQASLDPSIDLFKPSEDGKLLDIDKPAFYLLVLLYFIQGIPVGLAFGSIPFLMKSSHLSFSQLGTFSLASYPYSLKLCWSPLVDAFYSKKIGRRRSWIIPIQFITGSVFVLLGFQIDLIFQDLAANLNKLTLCFFCLVLMASTQDIAVDSWALVILSPASKNYASTAQTVGLNTGYFLSFTVFLAFNSKEFMNKYFRSASNQKDYGLITLGQYMVFAGLITIICTFYLLFRVPEVPAHLRTNLTHYDQMVNDGDIDDTEQDFAIDHYSSALTPNSIWRSGLINLKLTYSKMFRVLSLGTIQQFILILLICKFGFMINESATNLKLLDRGFSKEDLSLTVLIDFPFEIFFGYYVAKHSRGTSALTPWLYGYVGRLAAALLGQLIVYIFPIRINKETGQEEPVVTFSYFILVIIQHLFSSLMGTFQFVSLSAFHTRIADPIIGGTYMTTLNTLSNFGGTWPKIFLLKLIDYFTTAYCVPQDLTKLVYSTFWDSAKLLFLSNSKLSLDELALLKGFHPDKFDESRFKDYLQSLVKNNAFSPEKYSKFKEIEKVEFWQGSQQISSFFSCASDPARQMCKNKFGDAATCIVVSDGYYVMNLICVACGTLLLAGFIWKKVAYLQSLDESAWRVN